MEDGEDGDFSNLLGNGKEHDEEQEENKDFGSDSLFPTFGLNGLGDNGEIYEHELKTLGQILQLLLPNLNMMMTNSSRTPIDSYKEFESKLSGLNGNSLIMDLEAAKMDDVSLGNLKFKLWKWPKRKKIDGMKCKLKYGKWDFDIWKWPKKKRKGSGKGLIGEEEMNINEKRKEELNKVTTSTVHMVSETRNSPLVLRTTDICKLEMIRPGVRIKKKLSNVDATSVAMTGGFEKTKAFVQATQEIKEDDLVKEGEEITCLGNVDYGVGGMKVNAGTKGTTTKTVDVYGGVLNFSQGVGNINVHKLVKCYRLELIIDPFASTAMNIDVKVEKDNVQHRNNWMFATLRNVYLDTSQLNENVKFDICK
nr:hypothetical protein [Tanacetum cinerariifolium]